jgi:hypothetical protein
VTLRLLPFSFGIGTLALIFACAASLDSVRGKYQAAPTCCTALRELPHEKLTHGTDRPFVLDEKALAFPFDSDKSFCKAFELPAGGPVSITLSSYVVGDPANWYMFYLVFQVLSSDFETTRFVGNRGLSMGQRGDVRDLGLA